MSGCPPQGRAALLQQNVIGFDLGIAPADAKQFLAHFPDMACAIDR
jgi:hypothetical protein